MGDFSSDPTQSLFDVNPESMMENLYQLAEPSSEPFLGEITGEYLLSNPVLKVPTLLDPLFPKVGLGALAGGSDLGKSMILRMLGIALVSRREEFLGFPFDPLHFSAIIAATEDGKEATSFLLQKQAFGLDPERLQGLRYIFEYEGELHVELDKRLTQKPADLVIVDCFADVFTGDLKETHAIRSFLSHYQKLSEKHQCLILFLHHTGKRTENMAPSKNHLLSGQGFEGKMRLVIELRADSYDPTLRHMCIVKGNYLPVEFKKESFVLKFDQENFNFSNTGQRVPFEQLMKSPQNSKSEQDQAKYVKAKELTSQGKTQEQVAQMLGLKTKGAISKLLDRGKERGWDK